MWPFNWFKKDTRTSIEVARDLAKEENQKELKNTINMIVKAIKYRARYGTSSYTYYYKGLFEPKNAAKNLFQIANGLTQKPHNFEVYVHVSPAITSEMFTTSPIYSGQYLEVKFGKDAIPGKLVLSEYTKQLLETDQKQA